MPLGSAGRAEGALRGLYFLTLPRTGTTVVTVGRTASAQTGLGGEVCFLGHLTILLLYC